MGDRRSTEHTRSRQAERVLADVPLDEEVVLVRMDVDGEDIEALLEQGIVPGCQLCPVRKSPVGGPTVYRIDGGLIAMRKDTAACLCVRSALAARRPPREGRKGPGPAALDSTGAVDAS